MSPWLLWAVWTLCCRLLVTVEVGGDLSLGRGLGEAILAGGGRAGDANANTFFEPLRQHLRGTDLAIANLEGCVRKQPGPPATRVRFDLSFPASSARALTMTGFNAFGMANNHSGDRGREGFGATRDTLLSLGLHPIAGIERINLHGTLLTVVALEYANWRQPHSWNASWVLDIDSQSQRVKWAQRVRQLASDGPVIVFLHGGAEDCDTIQDNEKLFHQELRTAGAAGVFGHHPHRIKMSVMPDGYPSFISLGSVMFDRRRSPDCFGLLVRLTFWAGTRVGMRVFPVHITSRAFRPLVWKQSAFCQQSRSTTEHR
ncbi:MAG: CapA family protein [Candidatus Riflebacteria bacterium]|nr:CapA family protein [Candidatus Riflebacteria bacterium]